MDDRLDESGGFTEKEVRSTKEAPVPSPAYAGDEFQRTFAVGKYLEVFIAQLSANRLVDRRWLEIARTHFQEGVSAARRAVMNNDSF